MTASQSSDKHESSRCWMGLLEYHALPLQGGAGSERQVVGCNGEDDEAGYRAACLLAEAVGMELEDG